MTTVPTTTTTLSSDITAFVLRPTTTINNPKNNCRKAFRSDFISQRYHQLILQTKNSSLPADHARWAPWSKGNTRRILIHFQGLVHYSDDSSPEARAGPSVSRLLQKKLDTWSRSAPFPFCSSPLGVSSFIGFGLYNLAAETRRIDRYVPFALFSGLCLNLHDSFTGSKTRPIIKNQNLFGRRI